MSIVAAFGLIAATQVQVGEVGGWYLFRGDGYCAATTTYGRDLDVFVRHDVADNTALLTLTRPTWRSVEAGRSYRVRIDFSNDRYYDGAPNRGVVLGDGEERSAGLTINLNGEEFIHDFATANWMEVRLEGTLIASLNLRGTGAVMRQVASCSAEAFREDTRDPFERLAPADTNDTSAASREPGYQPPRLRSGTISNDDYPASALRAQAQGTTRMSLQISAEGRVTGCSVVGSSGSAALDSTACTLAQRRYRFNPATRNGSPVTSTVSTFVNWRLPRE